MVRRNLLGFFVGLGFVGRPAIAGAAKDVKTLAAFRNRVAEQLRKRRPDLHIEEVGDASLHVFPPEGSAVDEWTLNVENLYRAYVNGQLDFDAAAEKLSRFEPADAPKPERATLVPLVRPKSYLNAFGDPPTGGGAVHRPIAAELEYFLAADGADRIAIMNREDAGKLGFPEAELWSIAFSNVLSRAGKLKIEPFDTGVWTLTSPNDLALSIMGIDGFWENPPFALKGAPAVAAMQKNLLTIVDAGRPEALGRVREWLHRLKDDPDTMSTSLLIRRNGGWSEF